MSRSDLLLFCQTNDYSMFFMIYKFVVSNSSLFELDVKNVEIQSTKHFFDKTKFRHTYVKFEILFIHKHELLNSHIKLNKLIKKNYTIKQCICALHHPLKKEICNKLSTQRHLSYPINLHCIIILGVTSTPNSTMSLFIATKQFGCRLLLALKTLFSTLN